jgi:hypothetical protein
MGDRRQKDSGGANYHYKTCKKIMSKETSKQIFLYLTTTAQMTCEKRRITTSLPPSEGFTFIVCEQDYLHTFEDECIGATRDLVTTGVAFLTRQENFIEEFLAALGFLLGVIAFLLV